MTKYDRKYHREYYLKNIDRIKKRNATKKNTILQKLSRRKCYLKNRKKYSMLNKIWIRKHPEKRKEYSKRYRLKRGEAQKVLSRWLNKSWISGKEWREIEQVVNLYIIAKNILDKTKRGDQNATNIKKHFRDCEFAFRGSKW